MSMISEMAVESTIHRICEKIEEEMRELDRGDDYTDNSEALESLKSVGRQALTLFEWSTPVWAEDYQKLFAEKD